jgi:GNAT superfamily N-acetyltransferase
LIEMRRLTLQDSMQAQALWLEAFPEDGDGFCDYYFTQLFPQDQYYGLFINGNLQSMAGVSRQKIRFLGNSLQVGFLRGVATRQSEQGKGYSSRVMEYVLHDLKSQGVPAAALKTYIHPFYHKFGFETCSYRCLREVKEHASVTGIELYRQVKQVPNEVLEAICACYQKYTADKDFFLERNVAYYRLMLMEALDLYDGILAIHRNASLQVDGYLVGFLEENGQLRAEELVCTETLHPQDFGELIEKFGCRTLVYKAFDSKEQADGMIRILNMAYFFQRRTDTVLSEKTQIYVRDPLFAENSGFWQTDLNRLPLWGNLKELTPGEAAVLLMESSGRMAGIFEEY